MRSKADETFVIVETIICPLQISQAIELIAFFFFFLAMQLRHQFELIEVYGPLLT